MKSKGRGASVARAAFLRNPLAPELRAQLVVDGEYSAGSNSNVEWCCPDCGFLWFAWPARRTRGEGCPPCASKRRADKISRDAAKKNPLPQWAIDEMRFPEDVSSGSHKKVEWRCEHGHTWTTSVYNRVGKKTGCPRCSRSRGEIEVFNFVQSLGYDCIPNIKGLFSKPQMEIDIYIPILRAGIEYNGSYHHTLEKQVELDDFKNKACKQMNIRLLTVWDYEWGTPGNKEMIADWLASCVSK